MLVGMNAVGCVKFRCYMGAVQQCAQCDAHQIQLHGAWLGSIAAAALAVLCIVL